MECGIIKIEFDEQIELADCSNWIFERSNWKGCVRATKLKKDGNHEFDIDEIHESTIQDIRHRIEDATGSLIAL